MHASMFSVSVRAPWCVVGREVGTRESTGPEAEAEAGVKLLVLEVFGVKIFVAGLPPRTP